MTTKEEYVRQLPDNATEHETGDFNAVTIPVKEGSLGARGEPRTQDFEKLIVFHGPNGSWIHQDYRVAPEKSRKKGKKRG